MSKGIKVSKEGVDVKTAEDKDLLISSQFDTGKIALTGELYIDLPEESFGSGTYSSIHTVEFAHNLGYIPMYLPMVKGYSAPLWEEEEPWGPIGDYIVNDLDSTLIPASDAWGPSLIFEDAWVNIGPEKLFLHIHRADAFADVFPVTFHARRATLYYTIFYNRIDEEVMYPLPELNPREEHIYATAKEYTAKGWGTLVDSSTGGVIRNSSLNYTANEVRGFYYITLSNEYGQGRTFPVKMVESADHPIQSITNDMKGYLGGGYIGAMYIGGNLI